MKNTVLFKGSTKKNKKSLKNKKRLNRVDSVRVDKKNKILFLREKKWKIEFTKTDLKNFFKKNTYRISILTISAVSVAIITLSSTSTAKVAQFYANSCLGGWENPGKAEGAPQVFDGSGEVFDASNSAILYNRMAEIFCGNFQAEIVDDSTIRKAVLKLSWQTEEEFKLTEEETGEETEASTEVIILDDVLLNEEILLFGTSSTSSIPEVVDTTEDVEVADPVEISEEEEEDDDTITINFDFEEETTSLDSDTTTIESDDFTASLQDILDAPADVPVEFTLTLEEGGETESVPTEEPTVEPEMPDEPAEEDGSEEVSFFKKIFKTVFAAEVEEEVGIITEFDSEEEAVSSDNETITIESDDFTSSLQDILDAPSDAPIEFILAEENEIGVEEIEILSVESDTITSEAEVSSDGDKIHSENLARYNDFLEIEYTFNSIDWQHLGFVGPDNLRDTEFELPIVEWGELEKLQVRVKNLPTIDKQPKVYLDSMWIEVRHSKEKILEPAKLENLSKKKSFSLNEELKFEFEFENEETTGLNSLLNSVKDLFSSKKFNVDKVQLINALGKQEEIESFIEYRGKNAVSIIIKPKNRSVRSGKYTLETYVETDDGETVIKQQEFYLGVLAINVNKSIYLPGEEAYLQMAALTDTGHTICDAALWMSIIDPDEIEMDFSTEDGTIFLSGECDGNNVTDVPDYFAYYDVNNVGTYNMKLINLDTGQEIEDSFEVRNEVAFEVERVGPTRIYPPATYQVMIYITANQDFNGDIVEYVPDSFEITNTSLTINNSSTTISLPENIIVGESEKEEKTTEIVWSVDIKKGDIRTLIYEFDAPDISPEFYLLGPLEFYE